MSNERNGIASLALANVEAPPGMVAEYAFRPGSRIKRARPADVVDVVRTLVERGIVPTTEVVVEQARSEDSPLHDEFEWRDGEAARLYRVEQARHVLRSVVVRYVDPDATEAPTEPTRYAVRVRPVSGDPDETALASSNTLALRALSRGSYLPCAVVLSDDELRARLVRQALVELRAWRTRYRALAALADVFERIDAVLDGESRIASG